MQKTLGVKADIMNVAEKLFCRFGFNKISMDRIAKESKHAKGSVYYHFSSKTEVVVLQDGKHEQQIFVPQCTEKQSPRKW